MQEEQHDNLPAENVLVDGNENNITETDTKSTDNDAVALIGNLIAESSEDESTDHNYGFETINYEALDMEALITALEKLVISDKIMAVKNQIEEIKHAFLNKYHHFIDEKREEFKAENPESVEEFEYNLPLKSKFDELYNNFRSKKSSHFKSLESDLKSNLQNRLAIIEELKLLVNPTENIKNNLKLFNDLRDRWKVAGSIPKDKYNHVWNNYHFHVENFYDYLHLDREARDIDFKHNLEAKFKILERAQVLVNEPDVMLAFRELQGLHKMWKEDIGPVSGEHREEVWQIFSDLTKKLHDKRELLFENLRGKEVENLAKKQEIIDAINELATKKVENHAGWQPLVVEVERLRSEFFNTGKVPNDLNEETWAKFKNAVRDFNIHKNSFYKDIKKDQNSNLEKKRALVLKAQELKDSEDFDTTTAILKKMQDDWKLIGHVPKKFSDVVWAEFRTACNFYFERLHAIKNENEEVELAAFEAKKNYLETLKTFELSGEHKTDLDAIKVHIEAWKKIGKVPVARRHIDGKFNKVLDALFEKLSMSKKDTEMLRFSNKLEQLSEQNDGRKIENEKIFLSKKVDEVQNEIFQLENNIQFFAKAKKDNPLVIEVFKNIDRLKLDLVTWKEKLKQIRSL